MNICTDPFLKTRLSNEGISTQVFDEILTWNEQKDMLEALHKFASNWFLSEEVDDFLYRDISIGAAVHDDMLSLFHFQYHVCKILEKLDFKNTKIVFYQSESCKYPTPVLSLLEKYNIKIKTAGYKYPYKCFKKNFETNAIARKQYSGIDYHIFYATNIFSDLKRLVYGKISQFKIGFTKIMYMKHGIPAIFIWPWGRLSRLANNMRGLTFDNNSFHILVQKADDIVESVSSTPSRVFKTVSKLKRLSKKGIFIWQTPPIDSTIRWFFAKYLFLRYEKLIQRQIRQKFDLVQFLDGFDDMDLHRDFIDEFGEFIFAHLNQIIIIIDNYFHKVNNGHQIKWNIVGYVNPFQIQVLAKFQKKMLLVHMSRFLNNQYFCDHLQKKINKSLYIGVSSKYEWERMVKQGFLESQLVKFTEEYFVQQRRDRKIQKKSNKISGATVLIIPPPLDVLSTYRMYMNSSFLLSFFIDILSVLDELGVAQIIIRPHPASNSINDFNFTYSDVYEYICNKMQLSNSTLKIRNNSDSIDLREEIIGADLTIGTLSAVAIDSFNFGADYIAYDRSIMPFENSLNFNIFSEGSIIPVIKTKEELKMFLSDYKRNNSTITDLIHPYYYPGEGITIADNCAITGF